MKIHPAAQGTVEWLTARSGIPTASEIDSIISPSWEPRKGEMPKTYLAAKLAERWLGGPLPSFTSIDTEFGSILEEFAVPFYELETGGTINRVGVCLTDDGRVGASPDGLLGDDCGLEIKCPRVETHTKYLLAGKLPQDYAVQVHASMYVTGRPRWKFMSFHRRMPPLILTIERDEAIQTAIGEALEPWLAALDAGWNKLCEINGGPPKRHTSAPAVPVEAEQPFDYRH